MVETIADDSVRLYRVYADLFGAGEVLTRKEVAELVGKSYSTAKHHLEKAVEHGLLNRRVEYMESGQAAYGYAKPDTMPRMEGM